MKTGIIDRFEEGFAVVEVEGRSQNIPRQLVPADAREGDVLVMVRKGWRIDRVATEQLNQEVRRLAYKVWD